MLLLCDVFVSTHRALACRYAAVGAQHSSCALACLCSNLPPAASVRADLSRRPLSPLFRQLRIPQLWPALLAALGVFSWLLFKVAFIELVSLF